MGREIKDTNMWEDQELRSVAHIYGEGYVMTLVVKERDVGYSYELDLIVADKLEGHYRSSVIYNLIDDAKEECAYLARSLEESVI